MEVEEIQTPVCKFSRVLLNNNGRNVNDDSANPDDEDDLKTAVNVNGGSSSTVVAAAGDNGNGVRLREWHPSSRIIRVSRASGGKDRHSKVLTSKGSRDRRVRLSVTTAIQFYDLQDRLGYDQPSKAVEWLIKAASEAISELPSLNGANFPETPNQLSDEKIRGMSTSDHEQGFDDSADVDDQLDGGDPSNFGQNQSQHLSLSKSACSSTSDTSKGSVGGLSLSRSDARVKARERARERAAKLEKGNEHHHNHAQNNNNNSSSFTDLLTGAAGNSPHQNPRQWAAPPPQPMDYFSSGLLNTSLSRAQHNFHSLPPQFNETQFSFVPDHLVPATTTGGDYNFINFNLQAGFNRGTLQSNSSSSVPTTLNFAQHPHSRYAAAPQNLDGSNLSFFNIGNSTPPPSTLENHHHHHHQFPLGLDARGLQLLYGDGSRHSDQKGKGKH